MTMEEAREFCPGCNDNPKLWREDLCDECLAKCKLLRGVTVESMRQAIKHIQYVSCRDNREPEFARFYRELADQPKTAESQ